jgi:hypothetical protein
MGRESIHREGKNLLGIRWRKFIPLFLFAISAHPLDSSLRWKDEVLRKKSLTEQH